MCVLACTHFLTSCHWGSLRNSCCLAPSSLLSPFSPHQAFINIDSWTFFPPGWAVSSLSGFAHIAPVPQWTHCNTSVSVPHWRAQHLQSTPDVSHQCWAQKNHLPWPAGNVLDIYQDCFRQNEEWSEISLPIWKTNVLLRSSTWSLCT